MVLEMSGSGVVRGNRFKKDILRELAGLSVSDDFSMADHVTALLVEEENRLLVRKDQDGGVVQMVSVFVCDKDELGFAEVFAVICGFVSVFRHRVHLESGSFVFNCDGTMLYQRDVDPVAVGSLE
jgi:hypothetical protein